MLKKVKVLNTNTLMIYPPPGMGAPFSVAGMEMDAWLVSSGQFVLLHTHGVLWVNVTDVVEVENDSAVKETSGINPLSSLRTLIGQDLKMVNLEFK